MILCRYVNNVEAMGGAMADIRKEPKMKEKDIVTFDGKDAEVKAVLPGLIVLKLQDGSVCGADPKSVKEKKEPKVKAPAKKKAE